MLNTELIKFEKLQKSIEKHLGLPSIPVVFDPIDEDSRLEMEDFKIIINNKYQDNYIESAKLLAYQLRRIFQIVTARCKDLFPAKCWRKELLEPTPTDYTLKLARAIEVDALAFVKYYLETFEKISVIHPSPTYEAGLKQYIETNSDLL